MHLKSFSSPKLWLVTWSGDDRVVFLFLEIFLKPIQKRQHHPLITTYMNDKCWKCKIIGSQIIKTWFHQNTTTCHQPSIYDIFSIEGCLYVHSVSWNKYHITVIIAFDSMWLEGCLLIWWGQICCVNVMRAKGRRLQRKGGLSYRKPVFTYNSNGSVGIRV